jgi:hypothetical protein
MSGKCGGHRQPNDEYAPCVFLQTCVARPCTPLSMPPYGGAFPDDGSVTV